MSLLTDLADPHSKRSKSAHKIAACVVDDPQSILSATTASLAARVGVSEPTVNRFCTGLGYKGFPDFKLALAAELARKQPRMAQDIEAGDSLGRATAKIFEGTHASLTRTQEHLDLDTLHRAVELLAQSRTITLCGLGASASVAMDAQHKLLRFPVPVTAQTDIINQRVIATGLGPGDCLVCISYTGRTTAMIDVARLGAANGAAVLGLTASDSPLARECQLVLTVRGAENTDLYTPMTSRIAQLVLIDALATGLALARGEDFLDHLQLVKKNLSGTRQPEGN